MAAKQKQTAADPVATLLAALGIDPSQLAAAAAASQEEAATPAEQKGKPGSKAVKPENAGEAPTSGQLYRLIMRGRDVGLSHVSIPTTRGAAADMIGAEAAAKTKAAKVKVLS